MVQRTCLRCFFLCAAQLPPERVHECVLLNCPPEERGVFFEKNNIKFILNIDHFIAETFCNTFGRFLLLVMRLNIFYIYQMFIFVYLWIIYISFAHCNLRGLAFLLIDL